ncbi:hypothetical protein D9M68_718140 [compost metagenome]
MLIAAEAMPTVPIAAPTAAPAPKLPMPPAPELLPVMMPASMGGTLLVRSSRQRQKISITPSSSKLRTPLVILAKKLLSRSLPMPTSSTMANNWTATPRTVL